MGSALSTPVERDTPGILQFILKEMFRRTDLADIYSLADPDRCKRYIIVATDAIESLFLKMNLRPGKKPDGTLYIQSIEGLVKSIPPEERAKQREYCGELAFFFIRIFQIFGALFLSMYDSRIPSTNPSGELKNTRIEDRPFINPKNLLGFGQRGGRLSIKNGSFYINNDGSIPYDILNYHLIAPSTDNRDPMRFDKHNLILDQYTLYNFSTGNRVLKENPEPIVGYYIDYNGINLQIQAKLTVQKKDLVYIVSLTNFEKKGSGWPPTKDITKLTIEQVPAERLEETRGPGSPPLSSGNTYPTIRGETLPTVLKAMFDKAILEILGEPPLSVVKFLKQFRYISSGSNADKITGTHVYVLHGQENESEVNIVFSDKLESEGKIIDLSIGAKLKITKLEHSDVRPLLKYKAEIIFDADNLKVKPPKYKELLSFPEHKDIDVASEPGKAPVSEKSVTIPQFLEKVFTDIIKNANDNDNENEYDFKTKDFKRTRDGLIKPYNSDKIPEPLRIKKLWEAMAKDPPVKAHCIARAVQLLSVDAIKGDLSKQPFTSICKLKFAYNKDGSLPYPGKSVISSSGIYALSLLFFEGLENEAPKILDRDDYIKYRENLQYLFEGYTDLENVEEVKPMTDIKATIPQFCKERDQNLPITAKLARNLRGITSDLIRQQQTHFQKALTLIFRLFDRKSIERDRKLKFSPQILYGGMPEIDAIANDTRDLLLNYYKGCELTYREGLHMVYDEEEAIKANRVNRAR